MAGFQPAWRTRTICPGSRPRRPAWQAGSRLVATAYHAAYTGDRGGQVTADPGPRDAHAIRNHQTVPSPRSREKPAGTAEISNWTGKAVAAPRTELDALLAREELDKAGVYLLIGNDPQTNAPRAYIGEAEVIRDRLKQHKTKEFWVSVVVFVSKDENLTKAHVRYLECRLLGEAAEINRFIVEQNQAGGAKLPESDREDMEVFWTASGSSSRSSDAISSRRSPNPL